MTDAASPAATPAMTGRILVVDDEPDLRTLYELTLLRAGHEVLCAGTLAEARGMLAAQSFDVLITDMRLPDGLGLELLREAASAQRGERCIMITAYGSAENAVEALKSGAFDYLTKPVDLKQFRAVVAAAVQSAPQAPFAAATAPAPLEVDVPESAHPPVSSPAGAPAPASARRTRRAAAPDAAGEPAKAAGAPGAAGDAGMPDALKRLVGESAAMRSVKRRIAKVARSMAPVLVHGESGTGKELVANAIHACSHRAEGPFVPVNCGAIPENLLEAEFFGARKGSYTGATQDREGFFHAARGGTLFLDEIGELPLAMQAKLLRAIQERRVRPLGAVQEEAVDVRIVSATHRDLAAEVQAGRFRQDLFYRLNVIEIVIPPLRERREDIPLLARTLLERIVRDTGMPMPDFDEERLQSLANAPLEGNVRELENLLHRAIALGDAGDSEFGAFDDEDTPAPPPSAAPAAAAAMQAAQSAQPAPPADGHADGHAAAPTGAGALPCSLQTWLDDQERVQLTRALAETGFNRTAAAALLGLSLRQMRYRMARLGIGAPDGAADDA